MYRGCLLLRCTYLVAYDCDPYTITSSLQAWGELERRVSDTVPPDPGSERMKQFNDGKTSAASTLIWILGDEK